jgi:MFS family permease
LFGCMIDRFSRRAGVLCATILLLTGIVLSTGASGTTIQGMIWMLIIGRGIVGCGSGGEYPTCGASVTEASNETSGLRKWRGVMVAMTGDFAIDIGIIMGG